MKKYFTLILLLLTTISITSCKKKEKKDVKPIVKGYTITENTTTINWIAYKTTNKVPVKGQFNKITIENNKKATTTLEALNKLKFNIPINSLFTNDTIRDGKLKKFFFGTMKNTNSISGTITMSDETSGFIDITMNGISHALPITCVVDNQMATFKSVMNLDNWQSQIAIEALNMVCKDLHSGDDGISKTWNEVQIEATTYFKFE